MRDYCSRCFLFLLSIARSSTGNFNSKVAPFATLHRADGRSSVGSRRRKSTIRVASACNSSSSSYSVRRNNVNVCNSSDNAGQMSR